MKLKVNKYVKAFFLCVFISAIAYTWQFISIHYIKNGVFPDSIFGLFFLVLGFALLFALLIGAPIAYCFWRYRVESFLFYFIAGSLSVGFAVTVTDNLTFIHYPEGFIIGGMVGLLYWVLVVGKQQKEIEKES